MCISVLKRTFRRCLREGVKTVLFDVSKQSKRECTSHANGCHTCRTKDHGTIQAALGILGTVAPGVDDAAERVKETGDGGGERVLQSSQAHEPQLSVVRLEHVLVTTLDGVKLGLGVVVHVRIL